MSAFVQFPLLLFMLVVVAKLQCKIVSELYMEIPEINKSSEVLTLLDL